MRHPCAPATARVLMLIVCVASGGACLHAESPVSTGAAASALRSEPNRFVAPAAVVDGDGSRERPWASLDRAVAGAKPGDWIQVAGGTVTRSGPLRLRASGSAEAPLRLSAAPGARVLLDCSGMKDEEQSRGINVQGDHWRVSGFDILGAPDNGIQVTGSHVVIEDCSASRCGDTGIQLSAPASDVLVLDCDAHHNYDAKNHGENADGFAAKFEIGANNIFRRCRAWENADDGYDLWRAKQTVRLEQCIAYRNGYNLWNDPAYEGDGNGFKLGGAKVAGRHVIVGCIAAGHPAAGFTQNNNPGPLTLLRCTSAGNQRSFALYLDSPIGSGNHKLVNCLALGGDRRIHEKVEQAGNSWLPPLPEEGPKDADFVSVDAARLIAPRHGDDGVRWDDVFRPVLSSPLSDAGVEDGLPFAGKAPPQGALEARVGK